MSYKNNNKGKQKQKRNIDYKQKIVNRRACNFMLRNIKLEEYFLGHGTEI